FSAYAYVTICGELKRHFRDRTWAVRVPRRLQDLALQVRRATEDLTSTLSRQPTAAEIAGRLGVSADTVVDGQRTSACYTSRSLNLPTPGGGEFADLLGAPDTDLELVDDQVTVAHLLLNLPLRERRMLALRFYGDYTQSEIAAVMGVSQMHVSRLLSRALGWLREAMLNDHPPPWRGGGDGPDRAGVQVRLLRRGTVITVRVHGEIERDTAAQLHTGLHSALAQTASRVVVDLSGVPLLDAAGVAVLLNAVHTADAVPVHLTIAGARPYVARILAVSGLPHLMSREDRTSRRQPGGRDDPPSRTRR
ncbi:MAG TPA: sigma-70 family RNA polymerase sigma factor, partial [Actinoplanes sp.]|nr:sigma-70 family RNA polymerase sigma factor [Actinoplanes sp.]